MAPSASAKQKRNWFSVLLMLLYIISFLILAYYFIHGIDFYTTSLAERPHHTDYRHWKPGGIIGHGFGMIGSFFMILLLLYSIRKRSSHLSRFGSIGKWLNVHIFLGINGPLFIILHSTFKFDGLVSVSFWSMIAVAASGIIGRYLYIQIPRNIDGHELSLDQVEKNYQTLSTELADNYNINLHESQRISKIMEKPVENHKSVTGTFFMLARGDLMRPLRLLKLKHYLKRKFQLSQDEIKEITEVIKRRTLLERRIRFWSGIHKLFHYWHVFHKPFAVIMYLIMLVHIGVSIWLGYTWIF